MTDEGQTHSTVGRSFEIDQRAIKIFLNWLPDNWIPREQKPDFYLDFLVELVEAGEPVGKSFGVQIKGYDDTAGAPKPLSYPFKTKHLSYYLNRSQHPVFLFLINVTTSEGYWLFAQKHLKQHVSPETLRNQKTLTVTFAPDDNLLNSAKFRCLLPEAEQFVRNLHPGSVQAALLKRKTELEQLDPRCSVSLEYKDGKEHILIGAKEQFSFETKVTTKNIDGWRKFFECGTEVKVEPGEVEIIGAPLLAEAFKKFSGSMQFGKQYSATCEITCSVDNTIKTIQIPGTVCAGTKFVTFDGGLAESPFEIKGQFPLNNEFRQEATTSINFNFDKWAKQPLLLLSYFNQAETLVRSLIESNSPKMEILVHGNPIWTGHLNNFDVGEIKDLSYPLKWLKQCRWIAQRYGINPTIPCVVDISDKTWTMVENLYGLLTEKKICTPHTSRTISFVAPNVPPGTKFDPIGTLEVERDDQSFDFFGTPIRVGRCKESISDLKVKSVTPVENECSEFVFETTASSKRTLLLV